MLRKCSPTLKARLRYIVGFTLIELMIVVAVMSILAAIAYPSYISHITKTHRVAAEGCLSEYSNWMERFYTTNLKYSQDQSGTTVNPPFNDATNKAAGTVMDCATDSQTGTNYSYSFVGTPTATTYSIQAVPINLQASRDTKCGTLTIDQSGTRTISGTDTLTDCW